MRVVFLSNYFNHHQKPLSQALAARCDYTFVATVPIAEERVAMGWGTEPEPAYVCHYDRETERAEEALAQADVLIAGSAPETLVQRCIQQGKVVFRYAERPLKNGSQWEKYLPRFVKWHWQNPGRKPVYMLCASAYTAEDYGRFGLFRGKTYRWGYFPEVKQYEDLEALLNGKKKASLLWVGRFLPWKHPDDAIQVAKRLKDAGMDFELNLIGRGEMEEVLHDMIQKMQLQKQVHLLGTMTPEEVRQHMERAEIFLFTSDRKEGWGAVLNEAMNSGCAVVANGAAGATPFLVQDGKNGCVYQNGDVSALHRKVEALLTNPGKTRHLGTSAYETMTSTWNGVLAAERFLQLAEAALTGDSMNLYTQGPCSPT